MVNRDIELEVARLSGSHSQLGESFKIVNERIENIGAGETRLFKLNVMALTAIGALLTIGTGFATFLQYWSNDRVSTFLEKAKLENDQTRGQMAGEIAAALKQNREEIVKFLGQSDIKIDDVRSSFGDPYILVLEPSIEKVNAQESKLNLDFWFDIYAKGSGAAKIIGARFVFDGPLVDILSKNKGYLDKNYARRMRAGLTWSYDSLVTETLPATVVYNLAVNGKCDDLKAVESELRGLTTLGTVGVRPELERGSGNTTTRQMKVVFDSDIPPIDCAKQQEEQ